MQDELLEQYFVREKYSLLGTTVLSNFICLISIKCSEIQYESSSLKKSMLYVNYLKVSNYLLLSLSRIVDYLIRAFIAALIRMICFTRVI